MRNLLKFIIFFITLFLIHLQCNGEDTQAKLIIEYTGDWRAVIKHNYGESNEQGTGNYELVYKNPDRLEVTATKLDTSQNKLVLYIYEDERIVASGSTRDAEGSVTVEYEFPF